MNDGFVSVVNLYMGDNASWVKLLIFYFLFSSSALKKKKRGVGFFG